LPPFEFGPLGAEFLEARLEVKACKQKTNAGILQILDGECGVCDADLHL
jgi:hypothetical protein